MRKPAVIAALRYRELVLRAAAPDLIVKAADLVEYDFILKSLLMLNRATTTLVLRWSVNNMWRKYNTDCLYCKAYYVVV